MQVLAIKRNETAACYFVFPERMMKISNKMLDIILVKDNPADVEL